MGQLQDIKERSQSRSERQKSRRAGREQGRRAGAGGYLAPPGPAAERFRKHWGEDYGSWLSEGLESAGLGDVNKSWEKSGLKEMGKQLTNSAMDAVSYIPGGDLWKQMGGNEAIYGEKAMSRAEKYNIAPGVAYAHSTEISQAEKRGQRPDVQKMRQQGMTAQSMKQVPPGAMPGGGGGGPYPSSQGFMDKYGTWVLIGAGGLAGYFLFVKGK